LGQNVRPGKRAWVVEVLAEYIRCPQSGRRKTPNSPHTQEFLLPRTWNPAQQIAIFLRRGPRIRPSLVQSRLSTNPPRGWDQTSHAPKCMKLYTSGLTPLYRRVIRRPGGGTRTVSLELRSFALFFSTHATEKCHGSVVLFGGSHCQRVQGRRTQVEAR
jgi:hypothetical protein